jgi:hypothetical protein
MTWFRPSDRLQKMQVEYISLLRVQAEPGTDLRGDPNPRGRPSLPPKPDPPPLVYSAGPHTSEALAEPAGPRAGAIRRISRAGRYGVIKAFVTLSASTSAKASLASSRA